MGDISYSSTCSNIPASQFYQRNLKNMVAKGIEYAKSPPVDQAPVQKVPTAAVSMRGSYGYAIFAQDILNIMFSCNGPGIFPWTASIKSPKRYILAGMDKRGYAKAIVGELVDSLSIEFPEYKVLDARKLKGPLAAANSLIHKIAENIPLGSGEVPQKEINDPATKSVAVLYGL